MKLRIHKKRRGRWFALSAKVQIAAGVSFLLLLIAGWLALGIFSDREFNTLSIFLKHRLSTQFYFYSPLGESYDIPMSALTPAQQRAELAFVEFVERHDDYHRALYLGM